LAVPNLTVAGPWYRQEMFQIKYANRRKKVLDIHFSMHNERIYENDQHDAAV
jgi:hypothetical protein